MSWLDRSFYSKQLQESLWLPLLAGQSRRAVFCPRQACSCWNMRIGEEVNWESYCRRAPRQEICTNLTFYLPVRVFRRQSSELAIRSPPHGFFHGLLKGQH